MPLVRTALDPESLLGAAQSIRLFCAADEGES